MGRVRILTKATPFDGPSGPSRKMYTLSTSPYARNSAEMVLLEAVTARFATKSFDSANQTKRTCRKAREWGGTCTLCWRGSMGGGHHGWGKPGKEAYLIHRPPAAPATSFASAVRRTHKQVTATTATTATSQSWQ